MTHLPPQETAAPKKAGKVVSIRWRRWSAMAAAFVLVSLAAWHLPQTVSQPPRSGEEIKADLSQAPELNPSTTSEDIAALEATPMAEAALDADDGLNDLVAGAPEATSNAPAAIAFTSGGGVAEKKSSQKSAAAAPADAVQNDAAEYKISLQGVEGSAWQGDDEAIPPVLFSSARAALQYSPVPETLPDEAFPSAAPVGASIADTGSANGVPYRKSNAYDETPEVHPDVTAEENVSANLFAGYDAGQTATYFGVLTLQGDGGSLLDYSPVAVEENGESRYELPRAAFESLVEELTAADIAFDLRTTGGDISALSEYGLVIIQP